MAMYNALGQIQKAFIVATAGEPADLASTLVFEQVEYSCREGSGEIDLITTRVRTHEVDESLTGDRGFVSGGDASKVITSYSGFEYDAAGRIIRSLEFGTNAASDGADGIQRVGG